MDRSHRPTESPETKNPPVLIAFTNTALRLDCLHASADCWWLVCLHCCTRAMRTGRHTAAGVKLHEGLHSCCGVWQRILRLLILSSSDLVRLQTSPHDLHNRLACKRQSTCWGNSAALQLRNGLSDIKPCLILPVLLRGSSYLSLTAHSQQRF